MKTKQNWIIFGFGIVILLLIFTAVYSTNNGISRQQAEQIARSYITAKGLQQPTNMQIDKQGKSWQILYEQTNFFGYKKIILITIDAKTGRVL